jgi:hypothetical protein
METGLKADLSIIKAWRATQRQSDLATARNYPP